jgi:hypothetical protein
MTTHEPRFGCFVPQQLDIGWRLRSGSQAVPRLRNCNIAIESSNSGGNALADVSVKQVLVHKQVVFDLLDVRGFETRIGSNLGNIRRTRSNRSISIVSRTKETTRSCALCGNKGVRCVVGNRVVIFPDE